jgi:hypothetical protein
MRFIMMALSLALLASSPAHAADDCETKATQIVRWRGATVMRHSSSHVELHHPAVPGDFTIDCHQGGAELFMSWNFGGQPSENFWNLAVYAGAIVTDASPKTIDDGAHACFRDGIDNRIEFGGLHFGCDATGKAFKFLVERVAGQ